MSEDAADVNLNEMSAQCDKPTANGHPVSLMGNGKHASKVTVGNQEAHESIPLATDTLLAQNGHTNGVVPGLQQDEPVEMEEFIPPDGGWGWVVAFASFWINGTVFGMLNTFGILLPKFVEVFSEQDDEHINTKVSLVASVALFTTFFMSMISSIAADQLGIRKVGVCGGLLAFAGLLASSFVKDLNLMYLTFGVMYGLGSSFMYSGSLVILGHYFKKRMGLVNGLVTTGSSLFTIGLPFLLDYMLKTRGLPFTLQIQSGIFATTVLCTLVFKPLIVHPKTDKQEISKQRAKSFLSTESVSRVVGSATGRLSGCLAFIKRYLNVEIWKNRGYVIWSIGITFSLFGYFIPLVHLNNYTIKMFPDMENKGKILVMVIGGVSGLGRLAAGKLSDMPWCNRIYFQQAAFALYGVSTLIIPLMSNFYGLLTVCVVLGWMDGCFICLLGPIAFDLVGPHSASQAMGSLLAMISIPLMLGPMIGGWIFDATENYHYAFYFAGVPPLIGAALMFLIPRAPRPEPEEAAGTQAGAFASISHWSIYEPAQGRVSKAQSTVTSQNLLFVGRHSHSVSRLGLDPSDMERAAELANIHRSRKPRSSTLVNPSHPAIHNYQKSQKCGFSSQPIIQS